MTSSPVSQESPAEPTMISLPWKVLVPDNQRHDVLRVKGGGRRIGLTDKYRTALYAATTLAAQQWARQGRVTIKTSVRLSVTLYEPDRRRRDVSNYLKQICDCLTRVAFVDDSQIDRVEVVRGPLSRGNPRAEILVADNITL